MTTTLDVPARVPVAINGHGLERALNRVQIIPDCCWVTERPYDRISFGSPATGQTIVRMHRLFYEWFVGLIPEGYEVDHLCRNVHCVRPDHLEAVTPRENKRRSMSPYGKNARKTHCKHGHEFTPENTRYEAGCRVCRTCNIDWKRAWRAARKAER